MHEVKPTLVRAVLWSLALVCVAVFLRAGFWQLGRAVDKEAQLAAADAVLATRQPVPLAQAVTAMPAWVALEGQFLPTPAVRLDNQRRGPAVGVQVYRAFRTDGGDVVWVDLGWRPLPADRQVPDEAPFGSEPQSLRGLLVPPPSAGLALGPASSPLADGGRLALRLEPAVLREAASTASAMSSSVIGVAVLRLDPTLALGYERDLDLLTNTLSPEKHRGYALQWFGFAAGLLLLSLFLQFRRRP